MTAYLFLASAIGIAILFVAYCTGFIPWWLNLLVSFPLYWMGYVAAHDAVHRSAHQSLLVNNVVGWTSTALFALPFSLMRKAHLSHHRRAGQHDDIERFGYQKSWSLPLGVIFGNLFFYGYFPKCNFREKLTAVFTIALTAGSILVFGETVLLGWVLPMQLVIALGMFTNIYLPHGPFAKWIDSNIPFLTGFHEEHHAMPGYPWHQLCERDIRIACNRKRARMKHLH